MTEKFRDKYRISSARLKGYDYGANGLYFVTICTKNRIHYFGEITGIPAETDNYPSLHKNNQNNPIPVETDNYPSLRCTIIGKIANDYWREIPQHFPFVALDEFVVMPNHIHALLLFDRPDKIDWTPNKFGKQSQNLGSVIRGFKASLKRFANQNNIEFDWQERFHDHIIRNENELQNIRKYIIDNPLHWMNDELNKYVVETDNYPSIR